MSFQLVFHPSARKAFLQLDAPTKARIQQALLAMMAFLTEHHPKPPPQVKELKGHREKTWRLRVGDHRVVYRVNRGKLEVLVLRVGHRSEVYQDRS